MQVLHEFGHGSRNFLSEPMVGMGRSTLDAVRRESLRRIRRPLRLRLVEKGRSSLIRPSGRARRCTRSRSYDPVRPSASLITKSTPSSSITQIGGRHYGHFDEFVATEDILGPSSRSRSRSDAIFSGAYALQSCIYHCCLVSYASRQRPLREAEQKIPQGREILPAPGMRCAPVRCSAHAMPSTLMAAIQVMPTATGNTTV